VRRAIALDAGLDPELRHHAAQSLRDEATKTAALTELALAGHAGSASSLRWVDPPAAIPALERIVQESDHDEVRRAAARCLESVRDIARMIERQ
jgi:HEAT repeat protein